MFPRLSAKYLIETPGDPHRAAETIAGEQSCGTFVRVPGETDELRNRFGARVEHVEVIGEVDTPSLSGAAVPQSGRRHTRALVELSWSTENTGTALTTVMATVAGNLFELHQLSGCRLIELNLPECFAQAYPGPQFGVAGTRRLAGVTEGPLIGTIMKPSVGLSPAQTAMTVKLLAEAGIDVIKDDELMTNPPHSPLRERVAAVMSVVNEVAQRTGKKVMYCFNISDEPDAMRRHHDTVLAAGGTCVMASVNCVGLAGIVHLRKHCALPIHGHRNGWGMLTRHPLLGMSFSAYQTFWRLAGVDQLHVNGLANKFCESDDSVVASIAALRKPFHHHVAPMPVISSGQWGGQVDETYKRTQTLDVMYLAGGGVMANPMGPAAGIRAMRLCWDAAQRGIPLAEHARNHPELQAQLDQFGANSPASRPA